MMLVEWFRYLDTAGVICLFRPRQPWKGRHIRLRASMPNTWSAMNQSLEAGLRSRVCYQSVYISTCLIVGRRGITSLEIALEIKINADLGSTACGQLTYHGCLAQTSLPPRQLNASQVEEKSGLRRRKSCTLQRDSTG